eukprot:CAMPEP_0201545492 /NCGR_PEP_ID=MMETSP0173_2-20130828/1995_1 /ASSEMBLY_ACC=CAM_ASM_000268 /TAXON_ID=218659 /ORGANISM="Vexillifera sp., Strain DIVA3 564/2" /LENGTH=469 /DNA_ID=CAMNT_0047953905 /DNA_START=37 /DNA_END=1443 /DNA_ORIENTATION=+
MIWKTLILLLITFLVVVIAERNQPPLIGPYEYYCQANLTQPIASDLISQGYKLEFVQIITRHGDRTATANPPMPVPNNDVSWECNLEQFGLPTVKDNTVSTSFGRMYRESYLEGRQTLPGDCRYGQLTAKGASQHITLGGAFAKSYVDHYNFLKKQFSPQDTWVRSTDVQRTLNSVEADLVGFFNASVHQDVDEHYADRVRQLLPKLNHFILSQLDVPTAHQLFDLSLDQLLKKVDAMDDDVQATLTELINIHSIDDNTDNMSPNTKLCPQLQTIYDQIQASPQLDQHFKERDALRQEIAQLGFFGGDAASVRINSFTDTIWPRICHGFDLPHGVNQSLFERAWQWNTNQYNWVWWGNKKALPLAIGSFVGEIVNYFETYMNNRTMLPAEKLLYFSGHDSTIFPLTKSLGIWDGFWPPYASHVELELWTPPNQPNNYMVRTLYNGEERVTSGCKSSLCAWDTWKAGIDW